MKNKFYGTGVALITPFNEDLSIDFDSFEKLLHYVSNNGANYLVILGTTGESSTLTKKEKAEVINFVKKHNPQKLPIVLGHGGNDTRELIERFNEIDFNGIDAILSVSPYYNKPSQEGIFQHYTLLANTCPVPVILYNIPGRTASNMLASTTLRLAQHPNIIGTKEAAGDFPQVIEIIKHKPADFFVTAGDDILTLPLISVGGIGSISAISNALPKILSDMTNFAFASDYENARIELMKFADINKALFEEGNPVGVKCLLHILGICKPYVRLPLAKASEGLNQKMMELYHKIV
jgi:4-hydroxy-tetrahydrodipicolinate synthase